MHRPLEQMPRFSSSIEAFMARRDLAGLRPGDRVIVQIAGAGQTEALVLSAGAPDVLIRFSRWSEPVRVPEAAVLRRLPAKAAA